MRCSGVLGSVLPLLLLLSGCGSSSSDVALFNDVTYLATPTLGAEDLVIDHATGLAFVSCDDRRNPDSRGALYAYNLETSTPAFVDLTASITSLPDFHPHGISLHIAPDSTRWLFAVNHLDPETHTVEVFTYTGDALQHRYSIDDTSGLLTSPNDIVALDSARFYVTNTTAKKPGSISQLAEGLFNSKSGAVLYADLRTATAAGSIKHSLPFTRVAAPFGYANGINISPDGTLLYLATSLERTLYLYSIRPDGRLIEHSSHRFDTMLDNIDVAPDGMLWIAAQPKKLAFFRYAKNPKHPSPSEVLEVELNQSNTYESHRVVYRNDGTPLAASSVAARYGSTLLIGSVFDGILQATLPTP